MVPMSIKKNRLNETPLFKTCKKGNENIVKYLVELGVDINKINLFHSVKLFYIKPEKVEMKIL